MRTKEINGWVYKSESGDYNNSLFHTKFPLNFHDLNGVKAKLIIEVPEKKITISESEFDKAVNEALDVRGMCKAFLSELRQNLFGKEDG